MVFGVFIHRVDSVYQDNPSEQYQFPAQYLSRARACLGDWIVYYEPSKVVGTKGYYAIAKLSNIIPDPAIEDMYLALIEPGTYLEFANPVPFSGINGVIERGVLNENGRISGRAQAAVRPLSSSDFNRIVSIGLEEKEQLLPRIGSPTPSTGFEEEQATFEYESDRTRTSYLASRVLRDRVFRQVILRAYDSRCALTGLKLINGGGRAEVNAAHIRPVEASGPDIVRNGIALSGTVHWMFDRGLVGLNDNFEILISRHVNDDQSIRSFLNRDGRAIVPTRVSDQPHPSFLKWHRENCFKH